MQFQVELRKLALAKGAVLFGVADLERIRSDTELLDSCYDMFAKGISIGVNLDAAALADVIDGPRPLVR